MKPTATRRPRAGLGLASHVPSSQLKTRGASSTAAKSSKSGTSTAKRPEPAKPRSPS